MIQQIINQTLRVLTLVLKIVLALALITMGLLWITWVMLPNLSRMWQPFGLTLQKNSGLHWSHQRLHIPHLRLYYQGSQLLAVNGATVHYAANGESHRRWQITLASLSFNATCWQVWQRQFLTSPIEQTKRRPFSLSNWQAKLPSFQLVVRQLSFDTGPTSATLVLAQHAGILRAYYTHPMVSIQGTLDHQRKLMVAISLSQPLGKHLQQGTLQGEILLADKLNDWPERGQLQAQLQSNTVPQATQLHLQWSGISGHLLVVGEHPSPPLLLLPWKFVQNRLQFGNAQWNWPDSKLPLYGTMQVAITNWGRSKHADQWYHLGMELTATVKGRLPPHHAQLGSASIRANGRVSDLTSTTAVWQWDYQCQGLIGPQKVRWQSDGEGQWRNQQLTINQLSVSTDRWQQNDFTFEKARLTLKTPWQWRCHQQPFAAAARLAIQQLQLPNGRNVPHHTTIDLQFKESGRTVNNKNAGDKNHSVHEQQFTWQAVAQAGSLGPLSGHGSWDGHTLQGVLNLPAQSLVALQPLLNPQWNVHLQAGTLIGNTHFRVSATHPLILDGQLQIKSGSVQLKTGQLDSIALELPYNWRHQRWRFGSSDNPATLRMDMLQYRLKLRNITMDAHGYLPYHQDYPLQLSKMAMDTLGGHLSLPLLRLPQHQPGILKLTDIDLDQLTALFENNHLKLNGSVSGEFPVYTNHPQWLIYQGLLHNTTPIISSIDREVAVTMRQRYKISDNVIHWLKNLHVHHAQAQVNLDTLGQLTLQAVIKGFNPQHQQQPVHLNYQHQENLLTLWRSLQVNTDLQQHLMQ